MLAISLIGFHLNIIFFLFAFDFQQIFLRFFACFLKIYFVLIEG